MLRGRRDHDRPSSARGSALGFWCERSLSTLDKRLSRQRVCSPPFCTHALSGRAQLTLAPKRTSCRRHCKRRPCPTLLQPSSSLQLCYPVLTRRNAKISLSEPIVPCPSSRQPKRKVGWWRTRECCHGFLRKVYVLLHSHKPLGRCRWLSAPNGQHGHQGCWSRPDNASHVPRTTMRQSVRSWNDSRTSSKRILEWTPTWCLLPLLTLRSSSGFQHAFEEVERQRGLQDDPPRRMRGKQPQKVHPLRPRMSIRTRAVKRRAGEAGIAECEEISE